MGGQLFLAALDLLETETHLRKNKAEVDENRKVWTVN